ncbi:hypothetical protein UY3_15441 [Chelonia mydas]|uniref:Uncharacterized protein n=1 Tax=Chelonia mydas TaxID=8469 RepID=M7AS46_CHEMY|nr:hypothetical protein UY3_15441 [Chelonia mydas]
MDTLVTRVIFCKDGKEMLMLPKDRNKFIFESAQPVSPESAGEYSFRYQHKDDRNQETSLLSACRYLSAPAYSVAGSSGNISCGYMSRNDNNQVLKSLLSVARYLKVTDRSVHFCDPDHSNSGSCEKKSIPDGGRLRLEAIGGIAGLSVLCLAPLIYLLVKKVSAKQRCPRKQLPNRSTENTPTDEQILYANIGEFGTARVLVSQASNAAALQESIYPMYQEQTYRNTAGENESTECWE